MNARAAGLTILVAALAPAAPLHAQTEDRCDLLPNPTRDFIISNQGTPAESWYITEAVLVCPGGRRIVAQTATYSVAAGQITLNGNVQVDDVDRSLRSRPIVRCDARHERVVTHGFVRFGVCSDFAQ